MISGVLELELGTSIGDVIGHLDKYPLIRQYTKYLTPNLVVKATRRGKPNKRERHREFVLSWGVPNYEERQLIRKHTKENGQFPFWTGKAISRSR